MELQPVLIQNKIFAFRNQKVMIDRDLAQLYGVETRSLNQAVKRNLERFPEDFMFQLTDDEFQNWISQIVTSKPLEIIGLRKKPYAFTELGIAMLSSVLTSKTAIEINMKIMRAFVAVRQFLAIPPAERLTMLECEVKRLAATIDDTFADYNDFSEDTRTQLELLSKSLVELQEAKNNIQKPSPIGYIAIAQARAEAEKANKNKKKNKKTI
ncbi:DNA-binding protein [Bacteroidia bacterium]|nr:DNA-binding protein [Bacteroidia bacterium]